MESPFNLESASTYQQWRQQKLDAYPKIPEDLITMISNPGALSTGEIESIRRSCRKTNMAIYESRMPMGREAIRALAHQLGLVRMDHNVGAEDDGITSLQVGAGGKVSEYIPYSSKPLKWHTDGYYNTKQTRIHAFLLHCAGKAESGGENSLLDHEIAYILLRDQDPRYIEAFMADDAMTIPANIQGETVLRGECTGPVLFLHDDGRLCMRYTHRSRSIMWKDDPVLALARTALGEILERSSHIFRYTLDPGQGIVCNNVLHARTSFHDSQSHTRHFYRARFYDSVCANGWNLS
jgi:alpha-ketoglutarate-dependent taurine dioxygenase